MGFRLALTSWLIGSALFAATPSLHAQQAPIAAEKKADDEVVGDVYVVVTTREEGLLLTVSPPRK